MTLMIIGEIHMKADGRPLMALFDPGSTTTWINRRALPQGVNGLATTTVTGSTIGGTQLASLRPNAGTILSLVAIC